MAIPHTCYLEAEREKLRLMPPQLGKVRSRQRWTKSGIRTYWYLDFYPHLQGTERFLHGILGSSFADEAEAQRTLDRIALDSARLGLAEAAAQFRQPRARQNLVMTHAERWFAELGTSLAPATMHNYRTVLQSQLDYWAYKSIREISTGTLREWVASLRARGLADSTIQLAAAVLKLVLRRYREDHPEVPIPIWPRFQVARKPRAPMSLESILAVLARIPEPELGIYLCCLYTLCRPNEARGALVQDYDFREGRLTICRALKTSSGRNPVYGPTKTGQSGIYRLPADLRAWLAKYRGAARLRPQEPLFPNPRTGTPWQHGQLNRHWREACADAEISYIPIYRALKHSAGTALLEAGLSLQDLQAAYRHRSEATTLVYDLEDSRRRERATQRLEEIVGDCLRGADNNRVTMPTAQENGSAGSEGREAED